jgi:hypothetical protein
MTNGMTDTDNTAVEPDEIRHGTILTDAADPSDRKPWTVKGMPEWVIGAARDAAKARGVSMARWLTEVIPQAASPDGEAGHAMPVWTQVPAAVRPKAPPGHTEVSLVELTEIAKQLSAIEGLPPSVTKAAHGLLRDRLKAARRG